MPPGRTPFPTPGSPLPSCPLCASPGAPLREVAHGRRWHACGACGLLFVHPSDRPDPEAERAHYGTHHNDPADPGYRAFLARVADPLLARLPPGSRGLDYGSGPGPTLSRMLEEHGHRLALYDPYFAPEETVLRERYDFVACTETAEHFHRPGEEFRRLDGMLRPGGWLALMTGVLRDDRPLAGWRYARDPTHVCLYRPETLRWIAGRHGWALEEPHPDVALFRKPG